MMNWSKKAQKRGNLNLGAGSVAFDVERVALDGWAKATIEQGRNRLVVAIALFILCFSTLVVRLVDLSLLRQAEEPVVSRRELAHVARAEIVDRNGELLATTLGTGSLYADTREISDPESVAAGLVNVLPDLDYDEVLERLKSGRSFYWIKRNLTPKQQQEVMELGVPALRFVPEDRRVYPQGPLFSHVIGFVDSDNHGIAGLEKRFDGQLTDPARDDQPLVLSVDLRVQHVLRDELMRGMAEFEAAGAIGIVLDASSGEVLGMVSLPDFDPNEPGEADADMLFNRATLGVYEPGSTFKTFNTAMALDTGTAKVTDSFDATHPIHIARFTISDSHPKARWLTVAEIFAYSSNIGSAKMALAAGGDLQREYLRRFGMLSKSSLELPEIGEPLYPANWREISVMTISYGNGIAVTPIQIASGVAAAVNGGLLVPATILRREPGQSVPVTRAIRPETSEMMRELYRLNVTDGSGRIAFGYADKRHAEDAGWQVGGKTGTAEKAGIGGYHHKSLLTSFASVFPMSSPRYVVLCMLDEPKATKATHGLALAAWNAAPVARRVIDRIAPLLDVEPITTPDVKDPAIEVAFRP